MNLQDRSIDHINLTVPDLNAAIDYYTKVLGLRLRDQYVAGDRRFVYVTDGSMVYELMENKELLKTTIDHIAYVSDNIQEDYTFFKEHHQYLIQTDLGYVDFLFENGVYYFFISGSGDERIEFCQRKGS